MSTPPPAGRPQLDRARVIAAAMKLGDHHGPGAVSMRRVADALGCDPMALYWHVRNKDDLLDAVADQALSDLQMPSEGGWVDRLRGLCLALRRALLDHPVAAQRFAARPPLGPHAVGVVEAALAVMHEAGLPPEPAARLLQVLVSYTAGSIAQQIGVTASGAADRTLEVRTTLGAVAQQGFPLTAAAAAHLTERTGDDAFVFGLDLILTGAAAASDGRTPDARSSPA